MFDPPPPFFHRPWSLWNLKLLGAQLHRLIYLLIGLSLVAVGVIGIALPGVPTTGPLLGASFCLTKSSPWLQEKLFRVPILARYVSYFRGNQRIPIQARCWAAAWLWCNLAISTTLILHTGGAIVYLVPFMMAIGVIASVFIFKFRTRRQNVTHISNENFPLDKNVELELFREVTELGCWGHETTRRGTDPDATTFESSPPKPVKSEL